MKTKLFILLLMAIFGSSTYSQSITNTLGSSGSFIIKDGASTFFSLSQSNGNLTLSNNFYLPFTSSSNLGVIFKGNDRFIHDYNASGVDGFNTFIGINSGNFSMSGTSSFEASYNTGVGYFSLSQLTSGNANSAFGWYALNANTSGFSNSAFGMGSLFSNTEGYYNSAYGNLSLNSNTTGVDNSGFGVSSLRFNTTGYGNSAFGSRALNSNTIGGSNSAFGRGSLNYNTEGDANSAFGASSLPFNTIGSSNSAFGGNSLYANTTGSANAAFGNGALEQNTTGGNNSAFGFGAGNDITTGTNLTLIGYNAQPSSGTVSNEITFGNGNITTIRSNVQSITSLSDERDKKNIKELNLGIDFLMKIKPRLFNWDKREWYENNESDGSKMQKNPSAGFIAQELDTAQMSENVGWLNLVLKDNPDRVEATSGNLLPIIVKAIQDLKKENDQLKAKNEVAQVVNENLITTTNELNTRLTKFEKMQSQLIAEIEKLKANNDETTKVSLGTK